MDDQSITTSLPLTEEQINTIAERAAKKAVDLVMAKLTAQFYEEVGKNVVHKGLAALGIIGTMVLSWAVGKGYLKW